MKKRKELSFGFFSWNENSGFSFSYSLRHYSIQHLIFANMVKTVLIYTDVEPDDLIAIWYLVRFYHSFNMSLKFYVEVSESTVVAYKVPYTKLFMQLLQNAYPSVIESWTVHAGVASDKEFAGPVIPIDCKTILPDIEGIEYGGIERVVSFAPPRQILSYAHHDFFKNVDLHMYGSFNMRTLNATPEMVGTLTSMFRCVYWVEGFTFLGGENSFSSVTMPALAEEFSNMGTKPTLGPILKFIQNAMIAWNDFIIEECKQTVFSCENELAEVHGIGAGDALFVPTPALEKLMGKLHRNKKIVENITACRECQCVLADPIVVYGMFHPHIYMQGKLTGFTGAGYPIFAPIDTENGEASNLFVVKPDRVQENREGLIKNLMQLFQ